MSNLLILTEAGEGIGFGHLMRCKTIQESLEEMNQRAFLVLDYHGQMTFELSNAEVGNWREYSERKVKDLSKDFDKVLVDSYLAEEEFYAQLKKEFKKVIVIDDYNRITYQCDLIVNPNVFAKDLDYSDQRVNFVGGPEYVLLRRSFRDFEIGARRKILSLQNIVITMGGSDFRGILPDLAKSFSSQSFRVNVIAGNADLQQRMSKMFPEITWLGLLDETEMLHTLNNADLVISACGQTLHELAFLGVPTIGICLAEDQVPNQKYYLNHGFLKTEIHWDDEDLHENIKYGIVEFSKSSDVTFDGSHFKYGAHNFSKLLIEL